MATKTLYAGNNSNLVYLSELRNEQTNAAITSASVSATLFDADNVPVDGLSWPAAMTPVSGSNGNYVVTFPNTLNLIENAFYTLKVTAVVAGGLVGEWLVPMRALHRG